MGLQRCALHSSPVSLPCAAESWHLARNTLLPPPPNGMIGLPVGHPRSDACDIEADKQVGRCLTRRPHTPHYPFCSSLCSSPSRVLLGGVWQSKCVSLPLYIIWRAVRRCTSCFCTRLSPPYKQGSSSASSSSPVSSFSHPPPIPPREPYDPR